MKFLFTEIKIIVPATTKGKKYSITPIKPNINHLIARPTEPASSKFDNTKIAAHANAINTTISSFKP